MKKVIYLIGISLMSIGCGGTESDETISNDVEIVNETSDQDLLASNNMDPRTYGGAKHEGQNFIDANAAPLEVNASNEQLIGSYVGAFGQNMINITIFKAANGVAEGYSVCAGNFRKIDGTFSTTKGDVYVFSMKEPGDDKYDGKFDFTLIPETKTIEGKWTPFKAEGNSVKKYTLNKRSYKYDKTFGKYPMASQRELTDSDLNNLSEDELSEMRNEIYARHGYSFKSKDWRYHFEALDWYMPMGVDIREKLTDIEVVNIELIYEYESYFDDYYDDYGR